MCRSDGIARHILADRALGRDHIGSDAHTLQKTPQGGRNVPCRSTAHPSGVAIKGQEAWAAIPLQEGPPRLKDRFRSEVIAHHCLQQDGGASIDKVEHLHHVLPLLIGVAWRNGSILQIHLDLLQWLAWRKAACVYAGEDQG